MAKMSVFLFKYYKKCSTNQPIKWIFNYAINQSKTNYFCSVVNRVSACEKFFISHFLFYQLSWLFLSFSFFALG